MSGRQWPSVGPWWFYLSGDVELSDSLFRWLNSANSWRWTVWLDPGLWLVGWYDWLIAWHVPTVVDRFKYFSWAMAAICPLISNPELWLVEISFWSETERSLSVDVVAPFPAACRSRSVLMIGPFSLVGMFELNKELSLNFGLVFGLGLGFGFGQNFTWGAEYQIQANADETDVNSKLNLIFRHDKALDCQNVKGHFGDAPHFLHSE